MDKIDLSVIVPFYNEEENLPILHSELIRVLKSIKLNCEIIYVNDGSSDESLGELKNSIEKENSGGIDIKIVNFRKNFGQTAAVSAGIEKSKGNLVSFLDADLQNDPNDIPRFLGKLDEGYDAVFGWRKERKDATLRSFLSRSANRIINWVFSYPYHDVGCSARIVKKEYLKDIELYGELHRIMPVLIYLKGAKIGEIVVKHKGRTKGKSKYGFNRIVKALIDIITVKFLNSYGTKPAYVFGSFGFGCFILSLLLTVVILFRQIVLDINVTSGSLMLTIILLVFLGVQLIMTGLLAELQVRTYFESQGKPIYEIKEEWHF